MADTIAALLELWSIDQRRRELSKSRNAANSAQSKVEATWKAAESDAAIAQGEADKLDALTRQYASDVERCDKSIAELSAKKASAKSNKEYMDIHNGIEQARAEKTQREQSVKELATRKAALVEKAAAVAQKAAVAKAAFDEASKTTAVASVPVADEAELNRQAEAIIPRVDPEFLAAYQKLVKAGHKQPLVRVDPKTRSTPLGTLLSHNQIEQIRQGKLVIDRATNSIMYIG